jgi:hypothetical protein
MGNIIAALVFNKSQKLGAILLILLTCACLFLRPERTSGNEYLMAVLGWPLVIYCLNLLQPHKIEFVMAAPASEPANSESKPAA